MGWEETSQQTLECKATGLRQVGNKRKGAESSAWAHGMQSGLEQLRMCAAPQQPRKRIPGSIRGQRKDQMYGECWAHKQQHCGRGDGIDSRYRQVGGKSTSGLNTARKMAIWLCVSQPGSSQEVEAEDHTSSSMRQENRNKE